MGEIQQDVRRLGKSELGPHAFENCMPDRVARMIKTESPSNKSRGIITAVAALLERDAKVDVAYLCHKSVVQISRLAGEGNHFCAYRNIQMLLSRDPPPIYTITELQDMIEKAWDQGINPHGRVETGGIKGTRKHIGTSESQALFRSLNIPCEAAIFSSEDAWRALLDSVEAYFVAEVDDNHSTTDRIHMTARAPIFLQRPSHSLSIIGIERDRNGQRQLLVFDPGYRFFSWLTPCSSSSSSSSSTMSSFRRRLVLAQYRRDERYLKRFRKFETLSLVTVIDRTETNMEH